MDELKNNMKKAYENQMPSDKLMADTLKKMYNSENKNREKERTTIMKKNNIIKVAVAATVATAGIATVCNPVVAAKIPFLNDVFERLADNGVVSEQIADNSITVEETDEVSLSCYDEATGITVSCPEYTLYDNGKLFASIEIASETPFDIYDKITDEMDVKCSLGTVDSNVIFDYYGSGYFVDANTFIGIFEVENFDMNQEKNEDGNYSWKFAFNKLGIVAFKTVDTNTGLMCADGSQDGGELVDLVDYEGTWGNFNIPVKAQSVATKDIEINDVNESGNGLVSAKLTSYDVTFETRENGFEGGKALVVFDENYNLLSCSSCVNLFYDMSNPNFEEKVEELKTSEYAVDEESAVQPFNRTYSIPKDSSGVYAVMLNSASPMAERVSNPDSLSGEALYQYLSEGSDYSSFISFE